MGVDLHLGDALEFMRSGVTVDAVICDPPYGARTHAGHKKNDQRDTADRRDLCYSALAPSDVGEIVAAMSSACLGWIVAFSCSDLALVWRSAFERAGLQSFAPVLDFCPGMSCRMGGDGPSSWATYINVARPRTREFATWGTLPGGYLRSRDRSEDSHIGGKPVSLMRQIVRDYSRPGDTVLDPFMGAASTGLACMAEGRNFIGVEIDPETFAKAESRIAQRSHENTGQGQLLA